MRKYNRVVGTFVRKINKLEKIAEKNTTKILKLKEKAARFQARIANKIAKLEGMNQALGDEALSCENTAKKLTDLFS